MAEVFCAGIIVVDHVAAPVERLPDAGELVLTDECFLSIGGCASNVAVGLRKLGVSVAIGGLIGDDVFGEFARQILHSSGADAETIAVTRDAATSQTLIVNVQGQDRRFIHHLGANRLISGEHFPLERICAAKILYMGGFFLMGLSGTELANLFAAAQNAGVLTVLDVVTPAGGANHLQELALALPFTDVFLPNCDEARLMTGLDDPVEQAERFRSLGAKTVVVTCGGDGAVLLSETDRFHCGAYPTTFVDGTGGGDAFDAGYICGLLEGASPRRCLELGSAMGASCVRKSGATAGLFDRTEVEEFIQRHALLIGTLG